jgi:hypothetical protein
MALPGVVSILETLPRLAIVEGYEHRCRVMVTFREV